MFVCDQVAAQTNHQVTLVDVSDEILGKAENRIKTSLARVAKKKFPEDAKVSERERERESVVGKVWCSCFYL